MGLDSGTLGDEVRCQIRGWDGEEEEFAGAGRVHALGLGEVAVHDLRGGGVEGRGPVDVADVVDADPDGEEGVC